MIVATLYTLTIKAVGPLFIVSNKQALKALLCTGDISSEKSG